MPHIHTEHGQHDHTASGFIIRLDGPQPALMFHMHKKLGKYMQFGGHIELNETPWQTIAHELQEESGYELSQLEIMQPPHSLTSLHEAVIHPVPVAHNTHKFLDEGHFHTDLGYVLVTSEPPRHSVEEGESTDIRLFTYDEIKVLSVDKIHENVREISLYILEVVLKEWERIPASDFKL